jgi:hypothetical protein
VCKICDDTQEHALECNDLKRHITKHHETIFNIVKYVDIYGSVPDQFRITQVYTIIIQTREGLKKTPTEAYLGIIQDQVAS